MVRMLSDDGSGGVAKSVWGRAGVGRMEETQVG